jgi:hypothetical protein
VPAGRALMHGAKADIRNHKKIKGRAHRARPLYLLNGLSHLLKIKTLSAYIPIIPLFHYSIWIKLLEKLHPLCEINRPF